VLRWVAIDPFIDQDLNSIFELTDYTLFELLATQSNRLFPSVLVSELDFPSAIPFVILVAMLPSSL
jgi:hypothetical protein